MNKRNILWWIFACLCSVIAVSRFAETLISTNIKLKYKIIIAVVVVVLVILATIAKQSCRTGRTSQIVNLYMNDFGKYIEGAFKGRKTLKKRFEIAICNYHVDEFDKALKILDILYDRCESPDDYCAVLMFKGLCYQYTQNVSKSIEAYEELLKYNGSLPDVWLKLSIAYLNNNDYQNFMRCNQNCLTYDAQNAKAFSNIGIYYLRTGENEKALDYAMRALRIMPSLYQAMSTASAAYCMMGDMENCEKYKSMYIANGGDAESFNEYISRLSLNR